jgi:small conductance mechanosensitive channel
MDELLDEVNVDRISQNLIDFLFDVGPSLILAIVTLIVGFRLVRITKNLLIKSFNKTEKIDDSLSNFLVSFLTIGLKVLVVMTVVSMLGIDTTSFIAVLGAAGLAVGFALQGSLANFAGGVLILFFKPFKVGDFIDGNGQMGTVKSIDILHTVLATPDNKIIIIPNGALANSPVTNFSKEKTRRVEFPVGISYGSDIKQARAIILRILESDERVLKDPAPVVFLKELADSSLDLSARAWVKTEDFWGVFFDNLEKIKEEFDKEGVEIPFPQRDVHIYNKQ